ncbi:hypothetical protein HJC23_008091 [Cyclotella cryptica]|uniref:DNA-directed RNA polymerase III subunit RPC6 n=1 Tax=Cyclotella cryptica TaxID=29204 RepID=A0ABD3PFW6_9STRA|eukprot:CCRYP_014985-RB/>CCRYP_014985-RB protein AED:0.08 eAED:0.08 QI:175/1/1/1/1/1/3/114/324
MPPIKRPIITASTSATKRRRTDAADSAISSSGNNSDEELSLLQSRFISLLSLPEHKKGISNSDLKSHFHDDYTKLVSIINELTRSSKLTMSKVNTNGVNEVFFSLLTEEEATKLEGLDAHSKMVYRVIESSGDKGIWTVDIRAQTNIPQGTLTKVFKQLETRRLIKPIKAVTAKTKKLYMLYDLQPAKEITGGPWYTEYEFDHEFIAELRNFILMCVRRMNGGYGTGNGVTLKQISDKMTQANVSRVKLTLDEVQQLVQTLAFDYLIEQRGVTEEGEALFVAARRVTTMSEFGWWDVLDPDFHFRAVRFEDGVVLTPHEPHHHS